MILNSLGSTLEYLLSQDSAFSQPCQLAAPKSFLTKKCYHLYRDCFCVIPPSNNYFIVEFRHSLQKADTINPSFCFIEREDLLFLKK